MAAVSNSIVHLTMRYQKQVLSFGTGFIYQHESEYYIITAWHNLTGLHSETLEHLSEKLAIPDNIIINIAVHTPGIGFTRHPIILPLFDEDKSFFYIHPENWPRIDVAAIPFDPNAVFLSELHLPTGQQENIRFSPIMSVYGGGTTEICPVQKYFVPNNEVIKLWFQSVQVTEELFIPGYPHNIQDCYSQPVWKRATIASSVQQGWNREPKFLIDSASKSGMSGSPVLYYNPKGFIKIYGKAFQFSQPIAILAGVYVGRLGLQGEEDPQIGTVWNESVIEDIIKGKSFEKHPYKIKYTHRELIESMEDILATCSSQGIENIKNPDTQARYYIRHKLMKNINGRATPGSALEAVLEAAEKYNDPLVADKE